MHPTVAKSYERALTFAIKAHEGQVRNYSHLPYHTHLIEVALTAHHHLQPILGIDTLCNVVSAAVLHDVLEDTEVTRAGLFIAFGLDVTTLVVELTDVYTTTAFPNLNRAARKRREAQRLANISSLAKSIKCADLISNTTSIANQDPEFAKMYLAEKQDVLLAIYDGAYPELHALARDTLKASKSLLHTAIPSFRLTMC